MHADNVRIHTFTVCMWIREEPKRSVLFSVDANSTCNRLYISPVSIALAAVWSYDSWLIVGHAS